jgi:hypothetical protein
VSGRTIDALHPNKRIALRAPIVSAYSARDEEMDFGWHSRGGRIGCVFRRDSPVEASGDKSFSEAANRTDRYAAHPRSAGK